MTWRPEDHPEVRLMTSGASVAEQYNPRHILLLVAKMQMMVLDTIRTVRLRPASQEGSVENWDSEAPHTRRV